MLVNIVMIVMIVFLIVVILYICISFNNSVMNFLKIPEIKVCLYIRIVMKIKDFSVL